MTSTAVSESSSAAPRQIPQPSRHPLTLGELIEVVASVVPEDQVAETVAALFERRLATFARLLDREERAALRPRLNPAPTAH
jgi:hypothetical protein